MQWNGNGVLVVLLHILQVRPLILHVFLISCNPNRDHPIDLEKESTGKREQSFGLSLMLHSHQTQFMHPVSILKSMYSYDQRSCIRIERRTWRSRAFQAEWQWDIQIYSQCCYIAMSLKTLDSCSSHTWHQVCEHIFGQASSNEFARYLKVQDAKIGVSAKLGCKNTNTQKTS